MKGKHAQAKLGAVGAVPPNPLSLKTWRLGDGGGARGALHTRTGPGRPPLGVASISYPPLCLTLASWPMGRALGIGHAQGAHSGARTCPKE